MACFCDDKNEPLFEQYVNRTVLNYIFHCELIWCGRCLTCYKKQDQANAVSKEHKNFCNGDSTVGSTEDSNGDSTTDSSTNSEKKNAAGTLNMGKAGSGLKVAGVMVIAGGVIAGL